MIIDEDFKKFINISAELSGNNTLFVTDLKKIILCSPKTEFENRQISNELVNYDISNNNYIFNKDNLINILEENNPKYISQIILPIILDNNILGYFISINNSIIFQKVHLDYAETTLFFIKKFIKKQKK